MSLLRKLGIVLAALFGLLLFAAGLAYLLFDAEAAKKKLIDQVESRTGRQLTIAGQPGLSLWPDVGLQLGALSLSEADGRSAFASLQAARVSVAVLPLLSGHVEARRIELDGLSINLVKRRDGSLNIDDLLDRDGDDDEEAGKKDDKPASESASRIDVAGVALRQARLRWLDEASGKTTEISDLDLSTGKLSARPGEKRYAVEQVALSTRAGSDGQTLTLNLSVPAVSVEGDKLSATAVDLSALLEAAGRRIDARVALQGLGGDLEQPVVERFAFDLDATLGETQARAALTSPVAVDLPKRTILLKQLAGRLELSGPALPMKRLELPLNGRLQADLERQKADLSLLTKLDDSRIDLMLALGRFAPLAARFALDIDQLNVDRYLPPAPASTRGKPAESDAAPGKTVAAKIDLSPLKGLDVDGTVKVGRLQWRGLKLSSLVLGVDLAGGRLQLAPMRAALYGGSLDGRVAVDAGNQQFSIRQNLQGVAIGPLLKDFADKDVLDGRGSVTLDVTTRGDTVPALKRRLAGQAAVDLRDGAVKGINVAKLLRDAKAALKGQSTVSGTGNSAEKTDFSELTASFRIADGIAHNSDLAMKSPFLRLAGEGDIDIGQDSLNYLAMVSVVETSKGQEGKELDQLKGITVPLRLRGPYNKLAYSLDMGKLIEEAAKTRLKEKAEEKLGKELQKLFRK